MGVNLPDLDLSSASHTPSVTDKILEYGDRKGMSFFELYWPSACAFDSAVVTEGGDKDVTMLTKQMNGSMPNRSAVRVKSKKLSIPRENEGILGNFSEFGSVSSLKSKRSERLSRFAELESRIADSGFSL